MKKILSLIVAGVMAFGLIGCSGDLHDGVAPATLYMVGSATPNGWSTSSATPMVKNGTEFSVVVELNAGEFKFIENNGSASDWSDCGTQYGLDGAGNNQKTWSVVTPGTYDVSYDVATNTMTIKSLATPLDDPMKTSTIPWCFGGCGSLKLTKNGPIYTAEYDLTSAENTGTWGEDPGFVRFAIIGCIANAEGSAAEVGDAWKNVVTRYGFTSKESGYPTLEEGVDCVVVGKTITLKSMPGNGQNIVKGLEKGKVYTITVDFTDSSAPTLKVTEKASE